MSSIECRICRRDPRIVPQSAWCPGCRGALEEVTESVTVTKPVTPEPPNVMKPVTNVTKPVTLVTKPVTPEPIVTHPVTPPKHCPTCSCAKVYPSAAARQRAYRARRKAVPPEGSLPVGEDVAMEVS